jgi:hypothetical protein
MSKTKTPPKSDPAEVLRTLNAWRSVPHRLRDAIDQEDPTKPEVSAEEWKKRSAILNEFSQQGHALAVEAETRGLNGPEIETATEQVLAVLHHNLMPRYRRCLACKTEYAATVCSRAPGKFSHLLNCTGILNALHLTSEIRRLRLRLEGGPAETDVDEAPSGPLMRKCSGGWEIYYEKTHAVYVAALGLEYLAFLLSKKDQAFSPAEVIAVARRVVDTRTLKGASQDAIRLKDEDLKRTSLKKGEDPILDDDALQDCARRLKELPGLIEAAEGEKERQALEDERESIVAELKKVKNKHGKMKDLTPSNSASNRVSVSKAITEALGRINEAQPKAALDIRKSLDMGNTLRYYGPAWVVEQ